jgi:hypothetical protein
MAAPILDQLLQKNRKYDPWAILFLGNQFQLHNIWANTTFELPAYVHKTETAYT